MPNGTTPPDQSTHALLQDYTLRFRTLAEHINLGMIQVTWSRESRILSVNNTLATMLGYNIPDELSGMLTTDLFIRPADFNESVSDIARDGCIADRKTFLKRKDGSEVWVSIQAWTLQSPESPAMVVEAFVEDMTEHLVIEQEMHYHGSELNRYADALTKANKKLNILSSITRHDLLNKLTGLQGYVELMKGDFPDPKVQEYLTLEDEIIQSMTAYVQFTKDYQDLGIATPQWFEVKEAIGYAANSLSHLGIALTIETGNLSIYADPMLEKVFYNLVENSLRHGGDLTRISFTVETDGDTARIIYTDDGCGVPEEFKEDIFIRKHFRHTGFGLYLSREILDITGLTIRETGREGEGARFEIIIPRESFRIGDTVR